MKVMLDLNVLLDVVQRREPFYAASATVLSQAVEEPGTSCLPGHALTTLHYIVTKYAGREPANTLVDWVLAHLEIVPQDRAQFVRARNLRFDDFEDAALASAAEAAGCKLISREMWRTSAPRRCRPSLRKSSSSTADRWPLDYRPLSPPLDTPGPAPYTTDRPVEFYRAVGIWERNSIFGASAGSRIGRPSGAAPDGAGDGGAADLREGL